jgi:hypothetical protein
MADKALTGARVLDGARGDSCWGAVITVDAVGYRERPSATTLYGSGLKYPDQSVRVVAMFGLDGGMPKVSHYQLHHFAQTDVSHAG